MERGIPHWRELQVLLWALIIVGIPINFALSLNLLPVATILAYAPLVIPELAGAILIPIVAARARDLTLRRHITWLWIFLALDLVAVVLIPSISGDVMTVLISVFIGNIGGRLDPLSEFEVARPFERASYGGTFVYLAVGSQFRRVYPSLAGRIVVCVHGSKPEALTSLTNSLRSCCVHSSSGFFNHRCFTFRMVCQRSG